MTKTLLDLKGQPLVNNLLGSAQEALAAAKWPLRAVYDKNHTIHLDTEVPPEKLYQNYLYRSGVSAPYAEHCKQLHQSLSHLNQDVVMDIGGNDGTLLKMFKQQNNGEGRYINVDASASFQADNEQAGIEYTNAFFNAKLDLPKANIITSTNVFQHTKDIRSFIKGIVKFLDGVWVLEFPYALTTLLTRQFDQFYHEHYYYWLLSPLHSLFQEYGLGILLVQELPIHGGTMRLWLTNKASKEAEVVDIIEQYKAKESLIDFNNFQEDCDYTIMSRLDFIEDLNGRTVFFGAAAKGCVFLNALGLSIENMPDAYVVDDTPEKQGLFIPGTGFQVCARERLAEDKPDNVIILAHNFGDYIAKSLRQDGFKGKIYTCLPSIAEF
jgi:hypothetical protein